MVTSATAVVTTEIAAPKRKMPLKVASRRTRFFHKKKRKLLSSAGDCLMVYIFITVAHVGEKCKENLPKL